MSTTASLKIITVGQVRAVLGVRVADVDADVTKLADTALFLLGVDMKYLPIIKKYVVDLVREARPTTAPSPEHRAAAMDALAHDTRVVATETVCFEQIRVRVDVGVAEHEGHVLSLTEFKRDGVTVGVFVAIKLDAGPIVHRRQGDYREMGR